MGPSELLAILSAIFILPGLLLPIFGHKSKRLPSAVSLAAVLLAIALILSMVPSASGVINEGPGLFSFDWLGIVVALAAMFSAIIVSIALNGKERGDVFSSMMLFSLAGTVILAFATDVSIIIAGWALISVTGYALAAVMKDPSSIRNSIKYAVMGGVAAQFLVLAFLFLFVVTGKFTLLPNVDSPYFLTASLAFLLIAVGFKIGAAPFHMWLPDVYGYTNPVSVAALSSITKLGAIAVLVRASYYYMNTSIANAHIVVAIMAIIASISMFVGNLGALTQKNVQRMMAYSSVAHMGYILIALAVIPTSIYTGEVSSLYMAIAGLVIHVIAYSLGKAGIFASIDMLSGKAKPLIERFDGLGARNPSSAASVSILLLNLIGVPPLPGFWSKLLLFASAANPNLPGLVISGLPWLTLVGVINSVISVFYYAKVLIAMYWKPAKVLATIVQSSKLAVILSALLLLAIGVVAAPYLASVIM